jgi:glycosyltransferase involved in cell wall biosynthesis
LRFFEPHLTEESVGLASGFDVLCVFVNDRVNAAVIAKLLAVRFASGLWNERALSGNLPSAFPYMIVTGNPPSCSGKGCAAAASGLEVFPMRPELLSVILPVFNEADNLKELLPALFGNLEDLGLSYEVIVVDDGSTDHTTDVVRQLARPQLRLIQLRRNTGQTAALMAGIRFSKGDILISMDGDFQNDPADIPQLLAKLDEGYDLVSGWRQRRKDAALRRNLPSSLANRLISAVSGIHLHDYGCTLKAYRRQALQGVQLYGEMHRFIPIYAYWNGARVTEIPVRHHARRHGASHYTLIRIPKVLFDLLVVVFLHRFAQRPMYVFGGVGLFNFGVGLIAGGAALYYKFFGNKAFITTPLPLLFVMAFITGVMCFLMGLLAELLVRTYYESQNKATYMISYNGVEHDSDVVPHASERRVVQAFSHS